MDSIMEVRSEARLRQWACMVEDCQSSGMTVREWCRENGVAPKTYYYRLKQVRLRAIQDMPENISSVPVVRHEDDVSFKQLEVSTPSTAVSAVVTLHVPNGTLEVASGADKETIEAVLQALKTVC